jgi:hypothetical protein
VRAFVNSFAKNLEVEIMFIDDFERELLEQFKALTPEQLARAEARRKAMKDHDAAHTAIEQPNEENEDEE